jgi:hypothetical protein
MCRNEDARKQLSFDAIEYWSFYNNRVFTFIFKIPFLSELLCGE